MFSFVWWIIIWYLYGCLLFLCNLVYNLAACMMFMRFGGHQRRYLLCVCRFLFRCFSHPVGGIDFSVGFLWFLWMFIVWVSFFCRFNLILIAVFYFAWCSIFVGFPRFHWFVLFSFLFIDRLFIGFLRFLLIFHCFSLMFIYFSRIVVVFSNFCNGFPWFLWFWLIFIDICCFSWIVQ